MTNQQGAPEALRHAADIEHWARCDNGLRGTELRASAATLRRLHAQVEELSAAQAELAAMRAGGEPVAEMVPCHTPSGKRVAVISRFQHLPIGTKLYTHPQPAAQDAEDAARYRWMREQKAYVGVAPHPSELPKGQRTGWTTRLIYGDETSLDAAIDAAIAAQQGDSNE